MTQVPVKSKLIDLFAAAIQILPSTANTQGNVLSGGNELIFDGGCFGCRS